jgi:predicted enzyme related to lactoylglutathione lyase
MSKKKCEVKNMPKVVHFEIPADDPERAAKFYEDVFGWEINRWEGPFDYWLVTTGPDDEPGINGAIMTKEMGDAIRNTIGVESFDEFAEKIQENGGKMLTEKANIPGIGDMGAFQDTEGNVFVIMEPEPME